METLQRELVEWFLNEDHDFSGLNEDPPKGFAYKGVLPPSQLAKLTGVSTFDLVKVLEIPLLLNFGAFAHRSYPTIPLEIAREERDRMSIFSILNRTVTLVPTVETRD